MARNKVKEVGPDERSTPSAAHTPAETVASQGAGTLEDHLLELAAEGKLAEAAGGAILAQKKLGLPVTFKRGEQVIKAFPDGHEEVLTTLGRPTYKIPSGVRVLHSK